MSLSLERKYPLQYPADAVKVLNAMSFTKGKGIMVVGSSAIRSQQYAGDYDAHEIVKVDYKSEEEATKHLVKQFQLIIMKLMSMKRVYIGDIKSGVIDEWDVLKHSNRVKELAKKHILTPSEASMATKLLKDTTEIGKLKAKKELKFHIVRWTPKEVIAGKKKLRDGRIYTLQEAFKSPTITKLDVISLVQGKYTELSIIYEFKNGSKAINKTPQDIEQSLKNDIMLYESEGNRFKAVKRRFALAKLKDEKDNLKKYHDIINSEAGKLYVVYSDVKTLADLLELHTISKSEVQDAVDGFRHRLSRIYQDEHFLKKEPRLLAELGKAIKESNPHATLRKIEAELFESLNRQTAERGGAY